MKGTYLCFNTYAFVGQFPNNMDTIHPKRNCIPNIRTP